MSINRLFCVLYAENLMFCVGLTKSPIANKTLPTLEDRDLLRHNPPGEKRNESFSRG